MAKFQGRGRIELAERDADGNPGAFDFLGCADVFDIGFSLDEFSHFSKCDSTNSEDYRGTRTKTGDVTIALTEWTRQNVEKLILGRKAVAGSPGTVTDEELPTVEVGQSVQLGGGTPNETITTLVITDDAGTPVTLVANTDYTLDAYSGKVTFLAIPGTQPYHAAYGFTRKEFVAMFNAGTPEYWLRFVGVNAAANDASVLMHLYRVRLNPTDRFTVLPDEISTFNLTGAMLVDETKTASGSLGQFGKIIGVPAA